MADFSKARVGDKVYDLEFAEGRITSIGPDEVGVELTSLRVFYYDFSGAKKRQGYCQPTLYWSKPEISDPLPPKRTKKVRGWLPIWSAPKGKSGRLSYSVGDFIWESEAEARNNNEYYKTIIPIDFEVEDA